MVDPNIDHDTGHQDTEHHDKGHSPHPLHGRVINAVILSVVFLVISGIAAWFAGWLPPRYSHLVCQWQPVERINPAVPLSIVVARFRNDDGAETKHVVDALSRVLQHAISANDVTIAEACDDNHARQMVQESGAYLLLSGEVIIKDKVLTINLLPSSNESAREVRKNYTWTQQLDFDDSFKNDFGMQIAVLIEGMTEPPMLKRRIPLAHSSPGASEPYKGPDDSTYEWAKRIGQLEFMGKGIANCHLKLALGYIALTLGYREGLGGFVADAKQYFTDLKRDSICVAQSEFAALVHHHLGDLALGLANWERTPPVKLYLEAVDEYGAALSAQFASKDSLRRAISLQHLGMAYLKLAEHDATEKRTGWAEKARGPLDKANEVFQALYNEKRARDTQAAMRRLEELVAAQPPANSPNQQIGSQVQVQVSGR
jgi:hypothetical protein